VPSFSTGGWGGEKEGMKVNIFEGDGDNFGRVLEDEVDGG
jgi:hypothetical protein